MKNFSVKYRDKLATAAFLVIVITGLKLSSGLIMPFIFALFLAVITMPIVHVFKKIKLPHSLSVLASLTVVMAIMIVIGQFFYSSSKALTSNLKEYYEMFLVMVANFPFFEKMQSYGISIDALKDHITPQKFVGFGVDILGFFSTFSASFFLVIIITAFMLVEIETIKSKVQKLSKGDKEIPDKIINFTSSVKKYLLIKTLISILTGAIIGLGLYLLGVPHFVLFAVIAVFLNYIPSIGSVIAAIPAILISFIVLGPSYAVGVIILYGATNIILGSIVEPRFLGENLGISTLVVFSSLLIFGWIFGSSGMLLAIPLTMIIKIAAHNSKQWHWVSVVMDSK